MAKRTSHLILIAGLAVAACADAGDAASPWRAYIPGSEVPPPGACRIWYPDRPIDLQPEPGPCDTLRHQVPNDGVLVYG